MEEEKKTMEELHDHWKSSSTPDLYAPRVERSEFLTKYIRKCIVRNGQILEVGCNVGRNLNYLREQGYQNLSGIEISEEAVMAMKETFPELAEAAHIMNAPVEQIIKRLPSNSYDLVFSMAVLLHIHPDSDWVFEEMARISRDYIITVEAERASGWHIFPRNYKAIFEDLGFKQVTESNAKAAGLKAYTLRVFKKLK